MRLFGATEYLTITIGVDQTLRGARFRKKKMPEVCALAVVPPDERPLPERLAALGQQLSWGRDQILLIAPSTPGAVFFKMKTATMNKKELASALEFEVPQHILRQGVPIQTEFVSVPCGEDQLELSVWSTPAAELEPLFQALTELKWKADAILSPYLALTASSSGDVAAYFPEFDPEFFWQGDAFHPVDSTQQPDNAPLLAEIREHFHFQQEADIAATKDYLPALLLGKFAMQPDFNGKHQYLEIVPRPLKPQRLRSQLRLALILGSAFVLCYLGNSFDSIRNYNREYNQLKREAASLKTKTTTLQRRMNARNKELKEMTRILDMNLEQRDLIPRLGQLSEALPDNVLVTNLRVNETSIDVTMNTAQENLDLAESLRKISGFKVGTLQNRKVSDTLTTITLKLNRQQEKK